MIPRRLRIVRPTVAANRTVAEGEVLQVPDELPEEEAATLLRMRKAVPDDGSADALADGEPEHHDPTPETRDPKPTRTRKK